MRKKAISLLIILIFLHYLKGYSQLISCNESVITYEIVSSNGVLLRELPDTNSKIISAIPFRAEVMKCGYYVEWQDSIDMDAQNEWMQIYFDGKTGFTKKKFVRKKKPIVVNIGQLFIGNFFPADSNFIFARKSINKWMDPLIVFEKMEGIPDTFKLGGTTLTGYSSEKMNSYLFSIKGFKPKKDTLYAQTNFNFESKFLYPGESIYYNSEKALYVIYAKGNIIENNAKNDMQSFKAIENYELHIKREMNGAIEDKLIYKMNISAWNHFQYEGGVQIYWLGDIDNDNEMDLLLTTSSHFACWQVHFFLSSKKDSEKHFFKEVTSYPECGC